MIFEESFIFLPTKYPHGDWQPEGLDFEDISFESSDGMRLHGWYVPHKTPRAHLLFCHGNAGNLASRAPLMRYLYHQLEVSVFIFDYRGYGKSEGSPSEEGVLNDARAARQWLATRTGVDADQLVLLGRSLGGALAVDLAASGGARGLILDSTFTSLPDVAARLYPWAPVRLLMRTQLDSLTKIQRYSGPVFQSHSDADEIVPYGLGKQLFEAIPSAEKTFFTIAGADHNSPPTPPYFDALNEFLDRLRLPNYELDR